MEALITRDSWGFDPDTHFSQAGYARIERILEAQQVMERSLLRWDSVNGEEILNKILLRQLNGPSIKEKLIREVEFMVAVLEDICCYGSNATS